MQLEVRESGSQESHDGNIMVMATGVLGEPGKCRARDLVWAKDPTCGAWGLWMSKQHTEGVGSRGRMFVCECV